MFAHRTKGSPLISKIDSCGTGAYHVGADPDPRTRNVLRKHGITDYVHSARKVRPEDFLEFDWIMGMDSDNVDDLTRMQKRAIAKKAELDGEGAQGQGVAELRLWGDFGRKDKKGRGEEVVDPYYGANDGFEVRTWRIERLRKANALHEGCIRADEPFHRGIPRPPGAAQGEGRQRQAAVIRSAAGADRRSETDQPTSRP